MLCGVVCCLAVFERLQAQQQPVQGCLASIDVSYQAHKAAVADQAAQLVQGSDTVKVHTQHLQSCLCCPVHLICSAHTSILMQVQSQRPYFARFVFTLERHWSLMCG